jgi:GH15 family glucan-1,4-alpha-glucosidase
LTPLFLDLRFREQLTPAAFDLVERLARKAVSVAGQPDAGIWEYRSEWRPQTFSSLMCWAAADRMARIASQHHLASETEFRQAARSIVGEILERAVDPVRGCLVADYGGSEVDAALLQAVPLRLLPAEDARLTATVNTIATDLEHQGWLKRYRTDDGFGVPAVAFMLCTFWQIEALAYLGRAQEARALMDRVRAVQSPLGLLAEDLDPTTNRLWGNYPQAYSHVGMIHAAFAASPRWAEVGA